MPKLRRVLRVSLTLAFFNIRTNLGRSLIICLSLFFGIASALITMGILRAMNKGVEYEIEANGGIRTIYIQEIIPEGGRQARMMGMSPGLLPEQIDRVVKEVPGVLFSAPRAHYNGQISYGMVTYEHHCFFSNTHYFDMYLHKSVADGRMFTEKEYNDEKPVCLLGYDLNKWFFGDQSWKGKRVLFNDLPLEVIGVFREPITGLVAPMTLYWKYFSSRMNPLWKCEFVCDSIKNVPRIKKEIESFLLQQHRGIRDFTIDDAVGFQKELYDRIKSGKVITAVIGLVALLLSAIGIANVFLSIINEKIRDIGMLKALGGSNLDIFILQLTESAILALIGGILGTLGGAWFSKMPFLPWPGMLVFSDYAVSVGLACGVGLVSGLLPAVIAARLSPAKAIGFAS